MKINGKRQIKQGSITKDLFNIDQNESQNLGSLIEALSQGNNLLNIRTINGNINQTIPNKDYVDSSIMGFKIRKPVVGVVNNYSDLPNSNINDDDRVLVLNSDNNNQAGIYVYNNGNYTYKSDEVEDGAYWFVKDDKGWSLAQSGWGYVCTNENPVEIEQFTGVGQLTEGNGISIDASTNTISLKINQLEFQFNADKELEVKNISSDKIDISDLQGKFLIKNQNNKISAVDISAISPISFNNNTISIQDATAQNKGVVVLSDGQIDGANPTNKVIPEDVLVNKILNSIKSYIVNVNSQSNSVSFPITTASANFKVLNVFLNGVKLDSNEYSFDPQTNSVSLDQNETFENGDIVELQTIEI